MSFFSGLDTERYDRQYTDSQLVRRMGGYFKPHLQRLAAVTVLLFLIAGGSAITPIVVARGVDALNQSFSARAMTTLVSIVFAGGVVAWGANWMRRRLTVRMIADIVVALRIDAFTAAAEHDLSFYDEFQSGKVVSRITSDTQDFGNVVVLLTDLVSQFIQVFLLGAVLLSQDWRLTLMLTALLPLFFLVALGFRRIARTVTREGMRAMANVNAAIKETVGGIAVAKNFRQEGAIFEEFDLANRQSYRVNVRRGVVLAMVFPCLNALGGVGTALLVYTGGLSVVEGIVTAGAWFLFIQGLDRFFFPVLNLSAFWAQVQSGLSAAERVFALIDAEPQVHQTETRPVPVLSGEVIFDEVDFSYSNQEQVLKNFNLHIRAGETVALVGHTGAGKSSIGRLIARFYEFQGGRILVDGHDVRTFDLEQYRRQLGVVSQAPFLFSGTVIENICYACGHRPDREEVLDLAHRIGNGEWLETLSQGLDTEVGERGGRLSMGQRQLVSLMRVLVQKPAIFIFDEATASIDPFTEWQIQQALDLILENTTSILIAHRLSTVKAADRIIVIRKGKIIEEGSHEKLLTGGGHYAHLFNAYFRHQSANYRPEGMDEYLGAHD